MPARIPDSDPERGTVGGTVGATDRGAATDRDPGAARRDARTDCRADARADSRAPTDPERGAARPVTDDVIDVRGLLVRRAGRAILGPLDWTVRDGERWVIIGPNGSGKTTLLSAIGLELWPTGGTVDVLGARYGRLDSREHRRRIGAAGSAIEASLRGDLTPVTIVMTARNAATEPWWHVYTDEDRERARALLARLGLERVAGPPAGTLYAGGAQSTDD